MCFPVKEHNTHHILPLESNTSPIQALGPTAGGQGRAGTANDCEFTISKVQTVETSKVNYPNRFNRNRRGWRDNL